MVAGQPVGTGIFVFLFLAAGGAVVCNTAATILAQWLATRAENTLRQVLMEKLFSLGVPTGGRSTGQILSMLTSSVEKTAHYRAGFLGPIIGNLTTPLFSLALVAVFIDPVTAGILVLFLLLVPLLIGGFQKISRPVGARYRRSQAKLTAAFLESIQALPMLVYANAAARAADELEERGEKHRSTIMRLLASNQLLIFVVDASFYLSVVCAATGISVWRLRDGAVDMGDALAIILATILIVGPIDVVGMFFYVGIAGRAAQAGISQFLAAKPGNGTVRPTGTERTGVAGSVVFSGVTVGWPGAKPVVENFNLTVAPGEKVCLVGPSGIGKSTLSSVIQAHLTPAAGNVIVDGYDLGTTDPHVIRRSLAVIEQRTFLFMGTIADNLLAAKPGATPEELWQALELAGLSDEVAAMPHGIDTEVGEQGALLSGGQAQRLSIARAALRDAPIVIMDEPTSQVDIAGEKAILKALDRLSAGRTIIMIAHRPGAIGAADRTIPIGPADPPADTADSSVPPEAK
nr:ABC transporter ATP-binding protein [Corynebacterium mendelii]